MPTSPNSRTGGDGDKSAKTHSSGAAQSNRTGREERSTGDSYNDLGASSTVPSNGGKKDSHDNSGTKSDQEGSADQPGNRPTASSRRLKRQNIAARFAKYREEAQLIGLLPTEPTGAIRDERVDPATQTDQPQPNLMRKAIKSGWAVPEEIKPELVAEMTAIVTDDTEEVSDKTKVAAFRALLAADQAQHDRDNPQKTNKGGTVNVSVQTNIAAVDVLRESLKKVDINMSRKIKDV
jgi:hypothetical protein